nr:MAG TPA: hypothetical protein [Microviridae sp.]
MENCTSERRHGIFKSISMLITLLKTCGRC